MLRSTRYGFNLVLAVLLPTVISSASMAAPNPDPEVQRNVKMAEDLTRLSASIRADREAGRIDEVAKKEAIFDKLNAEYQQDTKRLVGKTVNELDELSLQATAMDKGFVKEDERELATIEKQNGKNSLATANKLVWLALNQEGAKDMTGCLASYKRALSIYSVSAKNKTEKRDYYRCMHSYYDSLKRVGKESEAQALVKPLTELYQESK
jgi:hypothetical protein